MKQLRVLMAVGVTASMLIAGCTSKTATEETPKGSTAPATTEAAATKPDTSKEVKLKMYLIGDAPKDLGLVYDEVNKMLKKDINATVEPVFLSWGDYAQKYPLLFATGEDFDLVFSANWYKFSEFANKGSFKELTPDLLNKYAPLTMKEMPKEAWDQAKVQNKIFMVPNSNKDFGMATVGIRGDLREKYKIAPLKTVDDYEKYLDTIAKNEPSLVPFDENGAGYSMYDMIIGAETTTKVVVSNSLLSIDLKDKSGKIIDVAQSPQYLEYAKKMADWNKRGFWSKNALVNKTPSKESFLAGKSASMAGNSLDMSNTVTAANQKHPEWKAEMFDLYNGKATYVNNYTGNGMSINANSKNPERALMMLDLFRNNEDYFNLTTYGIKGKHYDLTADKKIQALNGSDSGFKPDSGSPWGWRTAGLYKALADQPAAFTSIKEAWTKTAITNPLLNFVLDTTNIKNELAAIKNVKDQYRDPINLGVLADANEAVKTLNAKYKEAGLEKVQAEAQKQIDEFLKNNK